MIFKRGEFALQQHNKLRDLEVELLSKVCSEVEAYPI